MNIKVISKYIGIALLFNALFMFISAIVSAFNGFDSAFSPLLLSTIITSMVGGFPFIFVAESQKVTVNEGFVITFLSWIFSFLFGMLPYLLWGDVFTLSNAWFESVSGYTTTGATILTSVETLPKSLLFWRTSTHFIGGMGTIVFMLVVLPSISTFRMSKMQVSELTKNNFQYIKNKEALKIMSGTYIGLTVLCFIALMLAGMTPFDAINHAISTVATGGFSTRNQSILAYHSVPIEIVCMVFMYLSALHYGLLYLLVVKRSGAIFRSHVFRYFTIFLITASVLSGINLKVSGDAFTWGSAMRHSFFQVISLCTTTGFATADSNQWPVFSILILMFVMIHGSMSGSTAGGIKAERIWIFLKAIRLNLVKQLHPNAVVTIKTKDSIVDSNLINSSMFYIALYIFILLISSILLAAAGVGLIEAISAPMACMGNVGPGFGVCGSLGNFFTFPGIAKFILTINMILGRLEIYLVLMIFRIFGRH